uniref:BLOC-1-related complex subunit 6 C-terminal helix domain-containing protein n=1 Tax=Panagrolaimus sp. PS1159 TaxID=55785 RepID=A0AC35F178_9BILA
MSKEDNSGIAADDLAERITNLVGMTEEAETSTSSSPSLMNSPERRPGRVDASKTIKTTRQRRPSNELIPDPSVIRDLEVHARAISSNVDMCLRDLRGSLRGMSDLTLEFMQTYSSTINSACDNVDAAIKSQYKLIAKAEELNETMQDARKVAQQVKDMKRLVDLLESRLVADTHKS